VTVTRVFELLPMLDSPDYWCFDVESGDSILGGRSLISDFYPPAESVRNERPWQVNRLSPVWTRRKVRDFHPNQTNDYPTISLRIPMFSRRAVDVLRDLLAPNGELLPLDSDAGPDAYWAYNVTTVADVLDREKSDVEWLDIDRLRLKRGEPVQLIAAQNIRHYEFIREMLEPLCIFRLVEMPMYFYVTDTFTSRVAKHDLKGFNFKPVWPLPPPCRGSFAEMERRAGLQQPRGEGL
jgi:hypothetical protein